jgi:Fic family protein
MPITRFLSRTQNADMDVTPGLEWFLACLGRAIDRAQTELRGVLDKAELWERIRGVVMNDRQRLVLSKLLDGFEGKLTTTKYAKLTKSSQDTALRDMTYLVDKGVLVRSTEGGRSTSYKLNLVS